ncbi:MAG TPA: DUF1501 domain-containing protein, partial [Gemmataceae bacterium]|nr:DUF1501 domain-containing protein [Gemmataceae bacterium]
MLSPHNQSPTSRREFLLRSGGGFGALALTYLLGQDSKARSADAAPLAVRPPQFPARAKRVIFLFMEGGPSHLDTFDYKPRLNELAGKPLPASFGKIVTAMGEVGSPLLACKRKWQRQGQGGLWISDWLPHIAGCADDLAVLRSCWCDGINHSSGVCQMNTCSTIAGRPSLGSWVTYGLGTENQNLPAFVVLADGTGTINGPRNWGAAFMPAVYQGVRLQPG